MAWSWSSPATPVALIGSVDAAEKVAAFPGVPVTQAAWWNDYAWAMRQEFARRVKQYNLNVANVQLTVLATDAQGLGSLTLTFITS